ncbi:MarR family winged helix-turn-helix transcriptional regulator [Nocardioides mesophilus]|uniref:MarR family transcriptional regulator n=1 Tax=Nocardioides mesophilus TaxID=433659 RepID=A0A7G9RCP2_9ACTN|nr:MarR family transcriptional regulator [Nocardioides mesophilus]QNN53367.1 MarR family transcriptional regulator [Nocardioides mesophilus]
MGEISHDTMPAASALIRRPATLLRHQVMTALAHAGFGDILPAHLGVFQFPGPDGQRPGMLALRNASSKQAMNHLLHQLERGGYLVREHQEGDRRLRVVRLTETGWSAFDAISTVTEQVDKQWAELVGEDYPAFRRALIRLERSLEPVVDGW